MHHKSKRLNTSRRHALAIIRLATGSPSAGALLAAFDYREAVTALYKHVPSLDAVDSEDLRLILLAHGFMRAAWDAVLRPAPEHDVAYARRMAEAARSSIWATAYVLRSNSSKRTSRPRKDNRTVATTMAAGARS